LKTTPPVSQRILYEDNHLIAVNKLPSEIVQGDKTGDMPLSEIVKSYIKKKYDKPGEVYLGVIHRLDRPVSGVTVFARTSKALARMNELVKNRRMKKTYWAIVKNLPPEPEGTLIHYLLRNPRKNKSFVSRKASSGSKEAILRYRLIAESETYYLLEIDLETGRHHQIRAQLSAMGCPIRGDLKYGFDRSNPDASISLHARSIDFIHPVKKEKVRITADPPEDSLWTYFAAMFNPKGRQ
jgi:23S rRNA pseudouridine1911/1915/1917 synthase